MMLPPALREVGSTMAYAYVRFHNVGVIDRDLDPAMHASVVCEALVNRPVLRGPRNRPVVFDTVGYMKYDRDLRRHLYSSYPQRSAWQAELTEVFSLLRYLNGTA